MNKLRLSVIKDFPNFSRLWGRIRFCRDWLGILRSSLFRPPLISVNFHRPQYQVRLKLNHFYVQPQHGKDIYFYILFPEWGRFFKFLWHVLSIVWNSFWIYFFFLNFLTSWSSYIEGIWLDSNFTVSFYLGSFTGWVRHLLRLFPALQLPASQRWISGGNHPGMRSLQHVNWHLNFLIMCAFLDTDST